MKKRTTMTRVTGRMIGGGDDYDEDDYDEDLYDDTEIAEP